MSLLELILRETAAGPAGRIAFKVYRLVDHEVIDALYKAAVVYARVILDICNQEKKGPSPFAR